MHQFLTIVIIILTVIAFGVLGVTVWGQYYLLTTENTMKSEHFSLLPGIAVSTGVLIAALSFLREKEKTDAERRRHVSEVCLAQASAGFKTAIELLSDQNNNRETWIRAARTLLQAQELAKSIDSQEYKSAYQLEEEHTRNDLYKILTIIDPKTNARQPLPPQFFYGIEDWRSCSSLDDAAIRASDKIQAFSITIDSVPPTPNSRPLAPKSVQAIFSFVEYPEDYDDPLKNIVDWDENWDRSLNIDQGARRYVAHKKQKVVIDGKIQDK